MTHAAFSTAIDLVRTTSGYAETGIFLEQLAARNRIRAHLAMEDRARAGLLGTITLGAEAIESSALSLAQTLVHECYHLRQNPLLKTVSFWTGVATRTPFMRRYEQPAYQAAINFLEVVKRSHPHLASEAAAEQNAVRCVFANDYGVNLR